MSDSEIRLTVRAAGRSASLEGDLSEANAPEFESLLSSLEVDGRAAFALDLSGLDIGDGVAAATAVSCLRMLRARAGRLTLSGAPQILGHNLYRVGLLEGAGAIELIDMRLDEPSGF
ncbi:MAG TPA: STAS domain-containing protein [Blastocatellia bacterium]|nr:STAS domain-containing protein [Blastocatellia bacterium]